MYRKLLIIIIPMLMLISTESISQPGSYTYYFGFNLYVDNTQIIDTTDYKIFWLDTNNQVSCNYLLKSDRMFYLEDTSHHFVYNHYFEPEVRHLYIVSPQNDTMQITYIHNFNIIDGVYFIDSLGFMKGHYVLTYRMFDSYPSYKLVPQDWKELEIQYDNKNNVIITDFGNWNNRNQKMILFYDKEWQFLKSEIIE